MKIIDKYTQVRFGGLPVNAIEELTAPIMTSALSNLAEPYHFLGVEQNNISNKLYVAIGQLDPENRKRVISLRRELYKGNFSRAADLLTKIDTPVRNTLQHHIPKTCNFLTKLTEVYKTISVKFEEVLEYERFSLIEFSKNASFMAGIALSSPNLIPAINQFSKHALEKDINKNDKKAERSFHSYVLRSAAKTSPFSTLGPIAIVDRNKVCATNKRITRPSIYPLARIFNKLMQDPKLVGTLTVSLSPFTYEDTNSVAIRRTIWEFKDSKSRKDFAKPIESTVHIHQKPLTDITRSILNEQNMTVENFAKEFSEVTGIDIDSSYEVLSDLIRLGFLTIPELTLHPYDEKMLITTVQKITKVNPQLGRMLTDYIERSTNFSTITNPNDRTREITEIQELVAYMYGYVGIIGEVPRSVVYEDVLVDDIHSNSNFDVEVCDETVRKLFSLIDLLDESNVKHSLMVGYFANKNVDSMPLEDFILGFSNELFDSFERYGYDSKEVPDVDLPTDPWLQWGNAWKWIQARRSLQKHLINKISIIATTGILDFSFSQIDIGSIVEELLYAPFTPRFRHANILVQRDTKGQWVLNDAFGGIGFQVSRSTHLLNDAHNYTSEIESLASLQGVKLAELSGGALFTNLNFRSPILQSRIVIPGDPVRDIDKNMESIHFKDLKVRLDPEEKRLVICKDDQVIHPVYSGYLVPMATPLTNRILNLFTPSSQVTHKLSDLTSTAPSPGSIVVIPRITLDNLVVARARVLVHHADLPVPEPLTSTSYQKWLQTWLALNLPHRCFVRIHDDSNQRRKPNLFDIGQILCCSTLANDLKQATGEAYLEVEEFFPNSTIDKDVSTVSEFMIGISWIKDQKWTV